MSKPWALVCPASRGIGHHLTRALLRRTDLPVLATCRTDADGARARLLAGLPDAAGARLHLARVDVTDEASVRAAADRCAAELFPPAPRAAGGGGVGHHLGLAFALPGVLRVEKAVAHVDYDASLESFRVNALGPLLLMKHFARLLPRRAGGEGEEGEGRRRPAVWVNMSARVGSVSDNRQGGWYSYRASKAAVNSLTRTFDLQLRGGGGGGGGSGNTAAFAVAYHPGTVRTDFSRDFWAGAEARGQLLEPEDAAERMLDVVLALRPEQRGRIWDWKGEEVLP